MAFNVKIINNNSEVITIHQYEHSRLDIILLGMQRWLYCALEKLWLWEKKTFYLLKVVIVRKQFRGLGKPSLVFKTHRIMSIGSWYSKYWFHRNTMWSNFCQQTINQIHFWERFVRESLATVFYFYYVSYKNIRLKDSLFCKKKIEIASLFCKASGTCKFGRSICKKIRYNLKDLRKRIC